MDQTVNNILERVGRQHGTPCYVYFLERTRQRFDLLQDAFGGRFGVSYAVKCNPNIELLKRIKDKVVTLDTSSIAEVERGLAAGYDAKDMTFSGPAKRLFELERAVEIGVGEMVCESPWELEQLDRLAREAGKRVTIFIRINPARMPRRFGVNMAGKPSQFGIDEEDLDALLGQRAKWKNLDLKGFHIYSGTNSLNEEAIAENFGIFIELFTRFCEGHDIRPEKLIFGSGFGIPYMPDQGVLDLDKLAPPINSQLDAMKKHPLLGDAQCVLEMGRWLVGLNGYFLTSVINEKLSRGTEIRLCDAGFNNHLGACGMMGTVIRRNWRFWKVNSTGDEPVRPYLLVGPLCTTIDALATQIELPELHIGDILAIGSSGAYGLTASPTRFISHPEPREFLVVGSLTAPQFVDVTESCSNYPVGNTHLPETSHGHAC